MIKRKISRSASGNVLVVTVITLALVSGFVGLAVEYTNNIGRNVQRSILLRQAINIGDASTEMSFSSWRSIARAKGSGVLKKSDMDNEIPTPTPGNFPGVSYTLSNYTVSPLDSKWVPKTASSSTPSPIAGPNHNDLSYYFLATADVVIPTLTSKDSTSLTDRGNVVAQVRRVFQKETLSLWRYAIFFDDDLEMHPGANQFVTGEVHTNASLYTGHNLLTLNGKTTYADTWEVNFKPGDPRRGTETPTSPHWPANLPPANDQAQEPYDVALSDYHELIESTKVNSGLDPSLAQYRFETQAGVRVYIDGSNNVTIYNNAGTNITNATGGSADAKLANAFKNAITTNQVITDKREGATIGNGSVRLATLDVGAITNSLSGTSKITIPGRVIYITDTSATAGLNANGTVNASAVKRGIRLKNGGTLPDGGLTIVSGNPVYIQGDYNTGSIPSATAGATPTLQPPSNTQPTPAPGATPPSPTVAGYDRQPAAIVADAVNVLSNSWKDSNSASTVKAAPTTINAGIISGNVPTTTSNNTYSGGVENFPRFHEDWDDRVFTYYGSMIQLYQSQQAIGLWGPGYVPPDRSWFFDTNFITNPPPGILVAVNYRRSRWYML